MSVEYVTRPREPVPPSESGCSTLFYLFFLELTGKQEQALLIKTAACLISAVHLARESTSSKYGLQTPDGLKYIWWEGNLVTPLHVFEGSLSEAHACRCWALLQEIETGRLILAKESWTGSHPAQRVTDQVRFNPATGDLTYRRIIEAINGTAFRELPPPPSRLKELRRAYAMVNFFRSNLT